MKGYLLLLLSVLFCNLTWAEAPKAVAEPRVAWEIEGDMSGKVFLVFQGKRHLVIAKATAPYQALTRNEFKDYKIPSGAVLGAYSWYAGSGDVLYVKSKDGCWEVYQREMDEAEDSPYPVKKILTFPQ